MTAETLNFTTLKNASLRLLSKLYPMAKRGLYRFHGGVFPRYNKSMSLRHPLKPVYIPKTLVLPLQQHVGVVTEAQVQVGDRVLKNQLLADTEKGLAAPIHAPTSGTITAIENRVLPHASGLNGQCLVIETDGQDEAIDNALQVDGSRPQTPDELKALVHRAGIVGMGGAGFPTFAKIPSQRGQIQYLLINGAECEPFITCDDVLMQTQPQNIIQGALTVAEALGIEQIICGIEDNKAQAIQAMQKAANGTDVRIETVATVYPMGSQVQLTQELTGVELPANTHAVDAGILMMNVATFAAIHDAVTHGNPLISRLVTVSGEGLQDPFNIEALLGSSFEELAQLAQPKHPLDYPLIQGGPMMGIAMKSNQVPVIKTTNCILANPPQPMEEALPCIRCGECMDACPVNLLPQQMYWHSRSHEFDKVEKLKVFDCIECGCCSFVCPSQIPLVQYYRFAKSEIKKIKQEEQAAELAKQRHEFKLARLEREKQERDARLKAKKEAVKKKAAAEQAEANTSSASVAKKPASAAAAAQAAARARQKSAEKDSGIAPKLSAREKAIAAAKKRTEAAEKQAESQSAESKKKSDSKPDPKAAAMAAAKKRAAAKAAAQNSTNRASSDSASKPEAQTDSQPSAADKRKAAMEAAQKRAQAKKANEPKPKTETADAPKNTPKSTDGQASVQDKRQAAMAAAKKRAQAKQKAQAAGPQETEQAENPVTETPKNDTTEMPDAKRKAAMAAAKAKAAARAAQKRQADNANNTNDSATHQTDKDGH
jgi:electron transport complex protein RnfC